MSKRGQATIIIFLAIVLVVIILLFFYVRSKVYIGGAKIENLRRELDPIARNIEKCLYDLTVQYSTNIGQQGGYLEPLEGAYILHDSQRISILCYNIPGAKRCSNSYLRLEDIEAQLKTAVSAKLDSCIKLDSFKKSGYSLTVGNKELEISVGQDTIVATLNYPVKIKKDTMEAEMSIFSKVTPLPLGRLFYAATEIVNAESMAGMFDPFYYSVIKSQIANKPYVIQKLQPYPNKLYILKIKDIPEENNPYIFQFFIEGESK